MTTFVKQRERAVRTWDAIFAHYGRASAQFPSAAVYALPTAGRSAHRIVPHQMAES